jgi:hypothetical protein
MKVTGPTEPPTSATEGPDGREGVDAPAGESGAVESPFADRLSSASQPASAAAPDPAAGVAVSDLAADLQAGRLTPRAAVAEVLERVVAHQVGDDAPLAVRERVRAALEEALETDPLLAEKLKALGA